MARCPGGGCRSSSGGSALGARGNRGAAHGLYCRSFLNSDATDLVLGVLSVARQAADKGAMEEELWDIVNGCY